MKKYKLKLFNKVNLSDYRTLYKYTIIVLVIWTLAAAGSLVWNIKNEMDQTIQFARIEARGHFNKDQALRLWATSHGGVYVPANKRTPPNPNLSHIPERDITSPSGKCLTLMNPAYMIRQVMNDYSKQYGIKGKITSLKPIWPGNAPDEWERKALLAFEKGAEEVFEIFVRNGEGYLSLMRPMTTQKKCLKCHGYQGYKEGDIRGGVGVSVPMKSYLVYEQKHLSAICLSHGIIWILVLSLIGVGMKRIKQNIGEKKKAKEDLNNLTYNMGKRIKELHCFYNISNIVDKPGISHEEMLQGIVNIIPGSWQYPEITCSQIVLKGNKYRTNNFKESQWKQYSDIFINGDKVGFVEVYYLEKRENINEGPFLKEERFLLNAIAERLGKIFIRKQTEEMLREKEELLTNAIDKASIGMLLLKPDGYFYSVNQAFCDITGYSEKELLNRTFQEITHPDDYEIGAETVRKLLSGESDKGILEKRYIKKNGDTIIIHLTTTLLRDEKGEPLFFFTQAQDITEHKKIDEIIRVSNRFFEITNRHTHVGPMLDEFVKELQKVIGCHAIGIRLLDEEGNIPYESFTGFSKEFYNLESPLSIRLDQCMCVNIIKGEMDPQLPFITDGGSFYVNGTTAFLATVSEEDKGSRRNTCNEYGYESVALVPIVVENKIIGLIQAADKRLNMVPLDRVQLVERLAIELGSNIQRVQNEEEIRNLNEELGEKIDKRTAELETSNRDLEAFAYSVSHDLRAPLRHINGFAEILEKRIASVLDKDSQHHLQNILESTKRMSTMIDHLLHYSRMGQAEMNKIMVDMEQLFYEVLLELGEETDGRKINWVIGRLGAAFGDPSMLRLVLSNLISNALKFTVTRETAQIKVSSHIEDNEAVIFVHDNGVGFDTKYADKLFGVFQRLHRDEDFQGTGIGLANVRRIIQRHGGRTWAEGSVDEGATFYFTLPLQ